VKKIANLIKWNFMTKLFLIIIAPVTVLILVSASSFYIASQFTQYYDSLAHQKNPLVTNLALLRYHTNRALGAVTSMALNHNDQKELDRLKELITKSISEAEMTKEKIINTMEAVSHKEDINSVLNDHGIMLGYLGMGFDLATEPTAEKVTNITNALKGDFVNFSSQWYAKLDIAIEGVYKEIEADNLEVIALKKLAQVYNNIFSAVGIFISLLFPFLYSRNLSKRMRYIAHSLSSESNEVLSSSEQLSASSESLTSSATLQSESLSQTMASVEEINSMIRENANSAEKTKNLSENSESSSRNGIDAINKLTESIHKIKESSTQIQTQVEDSNREISGIVNVIKEIEQKTKVINDIVFQTKLLSFNASVEAARAGEHGKGFAVVAEEVAKLAQVSGGAAKEISELLSKSVLQVDNTINSASRRIAVITEESDRRISEGVIAADNCVRILNEISDSTSMSAKMMNQVYLASTEQEKGANEITGAMRRLEKVTQTTQVGAQEVSTEALRLKDQSSKLLGLSQDLSLEIDGSTR
jgi:methyl-accepting chemotaxis protein